MPMEKAKNLHVIREHFFKKKNLQEDPAQPFQVQCCCRFGPVGEGLLLLLQTSRTGRKKEWGKGGGSA